jgi:tetratricopeptide (TPR) repeat protein
MASFPFSLRRGTSALALALVLVLGLAACSSPEERAQAHYQSGLSLLEKKDYARAALEFRNAVKYNDKLIDAWAGLAKASQETNDVSTVDVSLTHVTELDPKRFDAVIQLAQIRLLTGDNEAALKLSNQALALKPGDIQSLGVRAAVELKMSDFNAAKADAEQILAKDPNNTDAFAVLAAEALLRGDRKSAMLMAERGLSVQPKNLGLLLLMLKAQEDAGDKAGIEKVLRQIIVAAPNNDAARRTFIQFLIADGRPAEAEAEMRKLASASPDDTQLGLDLAALVNQTRGPEAALQELKDLVAAHPAAAAYKLSLAQRTYLQGKAPDAIAILDALISSDAAAESRQKAQILLAAIQQDLGKIEEASRIIEEVLAKDQKNADALALRANIKLANRDPDGAITDLREALNQKPDDPALLALSAKAYEQQGSVNLAVESYVSAAKNSRYDPRLVLEASRFLTLRNRTQAAEQLLTEALTLHPSDRAVLMALAEIKLNKQDWRGAQELTNILKQAGDTTGLSERIQGAVYFGQGKYDESLEALKSAKEIAPTTSQPLAPIVQAYVSAGKLDEASAFLDEMLKLNPSDLEALILQGRIKSFAKKPDEAEKYFRAAMEKQPNSSAGVTALAELYFMLGRVDDAEKLLQEAKAKIPKDPAITLAIGSILETKGDTEGAIAILEEQWEVNPDNIVVANNLASLLSDYRTDKKSLDQAQDVAKVLESIDSPYYLDTLGWIAYRQEDFRTALSRLEDAKAKLPNNAIVRYHLGMTYLALKRPDDARKEFEAAKSLAGGQELLVKKVADALQSMN